MIKQVLAMARTERVAAATLVLVLATVCSSPSAQVSDHVVVYAADGAVGGARTLYFDRGLQLLGVINVAAMGGALEGGSTPATTDGEGTTWIALDPLSTTQLMRLDSRGGLLASAWIGDNPVNVAASREGDVYALTRIPLLSPGPMYAVSSELTTLWSNPAGPNEYLHYARRIAITTTGELWIGDSTSTSSFWFAPLIHQIDRSTGDVIKSFELPQIGGSGGDTLLPQLVADIDGTLWGYIKFGGMNMLAKTDGNSVLRMFSIGASGANGTGNVHVRVDGVGRLFVLGPQSLQGTTLECYEPIPPHDKTVYTLGGEIHGYALGATGEDAFVVVAKLEPPAYPRRLERINLVTGVKSSIPLDPVYVAADIALGDPTGFIYANTTDRHGDNDADGSTNGVETAAGSNPFDSSSRPNGPKVYLSFALSNGAPILKYVDPDGILNPTGGLHVPSLSLVSSQHGEIFPFLLSSLTFVQVSPNFTEVTALFGALPIPPDMKWRFDARVTDKSGATGWDWQVTRPGDL